MLNPMHEPEKRYDEPFSFSSDQLIVVSGIAFLLFFFITSSQCLASTGNIALFGDIEKRYLDVVTGWQAKILPVAKRLFWTLAIISMVWTFGQMALQKAEIGEFLAEFIRFTIYVGFFWWLLEKGPEYGKGIIDSMRQLAAEASGQGQDLKPGNIADMGLQIFAATLDAVSLTHPETFLGAILGLGIMVVMCLIAVDLCLMVISGWILVYAGIFFLGFGGSRWTSEMAINYYKTVLSVGTGIFTLILLVGIGASFIDTYFKGINVEKGTDPNYNDLAILLCATLIIYLLVAKVPHLISGLITGASIGAGGGAFGAAALGAGTMAYGAAKLAVAGFSVGAGALGSLGSLGADNMGKYFSGPKEGGPGTGAPGSTFTGYGSISGSSGSSSSTPLASAMGDRSGAYTPAPTGSDSGSSGGGGGG